MNYRIHSLFVVAAATLIVSAVSAARHVGGAGPAANGHEPSQHVWTPEVAMCFEVAANPPPCAAAPVR